METANDMKKERLADATYRNVNFVVALMLIVTMIALAIQVSKARGYAQEAAEQAKKSVNNALEMSLNQEEVAEDQRKQLIQIANSIESCVTPKGECSRRQQAGQAEAIGQLNAVTLAASWCNNQGPPITYVELLKCVKGIVG